MSPVLSFLHPREPEPAFPSGQGAEQNTSGSSTTWIIATIACGVIVASALLMIVVFTYHKRREYRKIRSTHPYITPDEFIRRQKMSAADLFEEEERQRQIMIRKSLANRSRSWNTTDSQSWNQTESRSSATISRVERETFEIEEQEPRNLREDWKAWEARLKHERSTSGEQHPLVPELRIPQPSQPSRSRSLTCPPVPPRHPGRVRPR
ncbi:hypothetical protein B0H63DRAFT_122824 [Podospora didyma]|uniref:Uncharacterized protein n=1 Tax=Podospora didyma TaxID=330526 RepID=A0AAE0U4Y4_9PEZI|nr:hypothetical protein B0H63DRAFT_122824 [Podospora didyma]